jgi:hypothetical protein
MGSTNGGGSFEYRNLILPMNFSGTHAEKFLLLVFHLSCFGNVLRKLVWTFLYLDIVSFSLEEKLFLAILTWSKKQNFYPVEHFLEFFLGDV